REALWAGSLRVGNGGGSFSQQLREAPEVCPGRQPAGEGRRYAESNRQLTVNIRRWSARESANSFVVSVRWTRPVPACDGGGSRAVSLDQQLEIAPGETVRLSGDAGLTVALTRRAP